MLQIAICDDEKSMGEYLKQLIENRLADDKEYRVKVFSSGAELLKNGKDFDIFFLDIHLKDMSGIDMARSLRQESEAVIVFVTALKEYVFDAFEVQAFDYLVKPLEKKRFQRTMDRAVKSIQQDTERSLLIQKGNSCMVIPLSQIVYCEIIGRKIYLHLADNQIIDYYEKLDKLEAKVDGRFFRCHRSYLVNLDFVRGCSDRQVLLPLCDKIPVSRLREQELLQALLRRMKS